MNTFKDVLILLAFAALGFGLMAWLGKSGGDMIGHAWADRLGADLATIDQAFEDLERRLNEIGR